MRGESPRKFRTVAVFLGCPGVALAAFSGLKLLGAPGPGVASAQPPTPRIIAIADASTRAETRGEVFMASGSAATERGDLAEADEQYRLAWRDPATRVSAAGALQDLHRMAGFRLPTDDAAVEKTARLLGSGFQRSETPHFVILSDCPPDWTQGRARVLERTRDQFFRVAARMGAPVYPHRAKLLCVLFARRDDYAAFARAHDGMEARWIAGYYATLSNRVVFYNDSTSPSFAAADERVADADAQVRTLRDRALDAERDGKADAAAQLRGKADDLDRQVRRERTRLGKAASASSTAKATHEATHLLAFNTGLQLPDREYPFWLSEGLATSFETDQADSAFGPDRPTGRNDRRQRFDELRADGKLLALDDLIGRCEAPSGDAERADAMYAQSYVLFTGLFNHDPRAMGGYLNALAEEPASRLKAAHSVEVFTSFFGDPVRIEQRILRRTK